MAIEIQLTHNYIALIDDIDSDLTEFKWHANNAVKCNSYAVRCLYPTGKIDSRIRVWMHRLILERIINRPLVSGEKCDHIDGDNHNNRRGNLRLASVSQNSQNKRLASNNKSGFKGAFFHKGANKWMSKIGVGGVYHYLGVFDTPELAHEAYKAAAVKYHGEFARFE